MFADSLQQLERVMDHARSRHGVLSSNVTNVDTPNYRAQDLEQPLFDDALQSELTRTHTGHVSGAAEAAGPSGAVDSDDRSPREDGNTVSLERQMAKLEENRVRYGAASTIISRRMALLRYAVTDGNG